MSSRSRVVLAFACGVVAAGAVNQLRWYIWPNSGGPQIGGPNGPQIFGWLGGHPYSFHVPPAA
jgi:hypothetical protein